MQFSDEQLARAVAAGDAAAESALCRRFAPRVRAYGLRHLRDHSAAADLVQSVLALVIDKLRAGEVSSPERIASFVLGTSRNVLSSWRRGDVRRREHLAALAPEPAFEPDHWLVDRDKLRGCLETLAPRERTVVMLTYYAEQTGPEIAGELGVEAGHVRVLRHRALQALHRCLEGA